MSDFNLKFFNLKFQNISAFACRIQLDSDVEESNYFSILAGKNEVDLRS